eukprot:4734731-Prymnesium_polylepis.1
MSWSGVWGQGARTVARWQGGPSVSSGGAARVRNGQFVFLFDEQTGTREARGTGSPGRPRGLRLRLANVRAGYCHRGVAHGSLRNVSFTAVAASDIRESLSRFSV